jgi:hypothetical protein
LLVDLDDGRKLLFDFANKRDPEDDSDLRVDLAAELSERLVAARSSGFDVVAFSHLDDDHIHGAIDFFRLWHDRRYQGDGRAEIYDLWAPAALIVEDNLKVEEAKVLQAEARYRLREGVGIRVFSRPELLREWLRQQGIRLEDREHLITDAGEHVPDFRKETDGVEFFVHSPFALRQNGELVDRNRDSLVMQATFSYLGRESRLFLSADSTHEVLTDIIRITHYYGNDEALVWDVMKIPHHCSYLSLSADKGEEVTRPVDEVKTLFEEFGQRRGIMVSTSKPIPSGDGDSQPPHRQAANYYKGVARASDGEFMVTMEHPKPSRPEPLVIIIDGFGARVEKAIVAGSSVVTSQNAPRAGRRSPRSG